ncbi:hypothetical protein GCM10023116_20400 [Kistimonas scapharcae]|uniref:Uncharacterized protein n=2 Tax=Kistimonas scapharcae TaxID=1036133 RepID=A0ABP8V2G0_9GAMM
MCFLATEDIPETQHLNSAEGTLHFVKKVDHQRYGSDVVKFGLTGIDEEFHYSSKSGALDKVYAALENADKHSVTVLFNPEDPRSAAFDDRVFFTVYALSVNQHSVRSFLDVREAWESDNRLGDWVGSSFIVFGFFLLVGAFFYPLSDLPNNGRR